jgi:hypothetical protein
VAIEVKGSSQISDRELHGLRAFDAEFAPKYLLAVCNESHERLTGRVRILPWRVFLEKLWDGHYK